jgi:hypothetical protein
LAKRALNIKFVGPDLDHLLTELSKQIAPDRWEGKKNGIINKGLKEVARKMLPAAWSNLAVGATGYNRLFTDLKRVRGGGWRISTAGAKALRLDEDRKPGARRGYYPASVEMGFKHWKSKKKVEGDHAMKKTMEEGRAKAIEDARAYYRGALKRLVNQIIKKKTVYGGTRQPIDNRKSFNGLPTVGKGIFEI